MDDRNDVKEPGPQPDPMLNEGPASGARKWGVSIVIAAVLLAVMYGVTAHRAEVKDEQRQSELQRDQGTATQPTQPLAGGRNDSNAPPSPAVTKPGG